MPRGPSGPGAARGWPSLAVPALVVALLTAVTAGPLLADVPEPPLVVDAEATDGRVHLSPTTQTVTGGRATWVLTNGGTDTLTFELGVHAVEATDDAVEVGDPVDVPLALGTVTVGPSEAARIPVPLGEDAPDAIALVATSVDAEPETRLAALALRGGGDRVEAHVRAADASRREVRVRLDAAAPALVDVALRASAWPGLVRASEVVEGVYVPAGGRDLVVTLDGPLVGRLTVDVAVGGTEPTRARAAVWWWPRPVVVGLLAVLVAAVVALGLVARRRRH